MLNGVFIKSPLIQIGVYKSLSKSLSNCFVNEMQFLCISPLYLTLDKLCRALTKQGDVILRICSFVNLPRGWLLFNGGIFRFLKHSIIHFLSALIFTGLFAEIVSIFCQFFSISYFFIPLGPFIVISKLIKGVVSIGVYPKVFPWEHLVFLKLCRLD
jgi:hypothetical protein